MQTSGLRTILGLISGADHQRALIVVVPLQTHSPSFAGLLICVGVCKIMRQVLLSEPCINFIEVIRPPEITLIRVRSKPDEGTLSLSPSPLLLHYYLV